jgi:hypothetical protein
MFQQCIDAIGVETYTFGINENSLNKEISVVEQSR